MQSTNAVSGYGQCQLAYSVAAANITQMMFTLESASV